VVLAARVDLVARAVLVGEVAAAAEVAMQMMEDIKVVNLII
jgi:hypothetical protein